MLSTDATAVGGTAAELVEIARNGALALAEAGFWVVRLHFPIFNGVGADGAPIVTCSCGKPGCKDSAGKHPVDSAWGKGATREVETVKRWFDGEPGRGGGSWKPWNVGIVLGVCHGIPAGEAVIDVEDDTDEGRELATELFGEDIHWAVYRSGGKSLHRLFRWSDGLPPVANLKVRGLEFRFGGKGKETQSVGPPSMHRSGRRYEWLAGGVGGKLVELPDIVKAFLLEEFERQRKNHATNGNGHAGGGNGKASRITKLHRPLGKIGVGERHDTLLTFANSKWRDACNSKGISRLEDIDVFEDILMDVLGRNLLCCEPPKTDEDIRLIVQSSRTFMMEQILSDADQQREITNPGEHERNDEVEHLRVGDQEPVSGSLTDKEDSRNMGKWLHSIGVRLSCDPSIDSMVKNSKRIDEWVADGWAVEFATKSDDDRVKVTVKGFKEPITMRASDFNRFDWFARRIHTGSCGAVTLNRTFASWDWRSVWDGRANDKTGKNGITRGLREWLETHARVVEDAASLLRDQVEDLILALAGSSREPVIQAVEEWEQRNQKCTERLKLNSRGGGGLVQLRAPEDPATGWYQVPVVVGEVAVAGGDGGVANEIHLFVKIDEVTKRYRSAYGSGVQNVKIAESLAEIGFEKQNVRRGSMQGRWFVKTKFEQ